MKAVESLSAFYALATNQLQLRINWARKNEEASADQPLATLPSLHDSCGREIHLSQNKRIADRASAQGAACNADDA
jgi:predicted DNA-binding WGR domain protein